MKEKCFVCGGDGLMYFNESQLDVPCDNCGGTGEVESNERHDLEIWLNEYLYKHVESVSVSQMAFDITSHIYGEKGDPKEYRTKCQECGAINPIDKFIWTDGKMYHPRKGIPHVGCGPITVEGEL